MKKSLEAQHGGIPIDAANFWLQLDIVSLQKTKKKKNADERVWGDARGDQKPETYFVALRFDPEKGSRGPDPSLGQTDPESRSDWPGIWVKKVFLTLIPGRFFIWKGIFVKDIMHSYWFLLSTYISACGFIRSILYGTSSAVAADLFTGYSTNGVVILAMFPYGLGSLLGAPISGTFGWFCCVLFYEFYNIVTKMVDGGTHTIGVI